MNDVPVDRSVAGMDPVRLLKLRSSKNAEIERLAVNEEVMK